MIDIHCHILPLVDVTTVLRRETSLEMCHGAEDGIEHIVATFTLTSAFLPTGLI